MSAPTSPPPPGAVPPPRPAAAAPPSSAAPISWGRLLAAFWRLARPYWGSPERPGALGLLGLVVALSLGSVYLLVQFNTWNQQFYDAVQAFDAALFWKLLGRFSWLAALYIVVNVFRSYFTQVLQNRWRRWMTRDLLDRWLTDKSHYLWQFGGHPSDNPDQRISEDVRDFVSQSLDLSVGLLNQAVTLASFIAILWTLSGPLTLPWVGGGSVTVPGYMALACLLYAAVGTWVTHRIGRPLIGLNYEQQHVEANFRFSLVRLRENGESVALSEGEASEGRGLRVLFDRIYGNFAALIRKQMHLDFFSIGYDQVAIIFPYLVAAPRYFAKQIKLGGLFQVANAFGQVKDALSWVVENYATLAYWRSVVERLDGFEADVARTKELRRTAQALVEEGPEDSGLVLEGLLLGLPDGVPLLASPLDRAFAPGSSVLVSGPSGAGKSTLLRAVRGLWPFAQGKVRLPKGAKVLVLPQRPYLPVGTLREALAYPSSPEAFTDEALRDAMAAAHLPDWTGRLDESGHWSLTLSLGEQQRVAWARVFLQRPDWLLLDEATSALDEASQAAVFGALRERLPQTTVLSVAHAHRPTEHHRETWIFGGGGGVDTSASRML